MLDLKRKNRSRCIQPDQVNLNDLVLSESVRRAVSGRFRATAAGLSDGVETAKNFYLGPGNTIMAVEVQGNGKSFEVGQSQSLFAAPVNPFTVTFDVAADGKKFVMSVVPEEENAPLTVMFNWTTKLVK